MILLCPPPDELERLLQGRLSAEDGTSLEAHLSACARCREALDRLTSPLGTDAPTDHSDPSLEYEAEWHDHQRTIEVAFLHQLRDCRRAERADAPLAEIPGYRVECRLGEGGAGIVYRARHEKLQRPVALKMLRPGTLDRAASRGRFQREAEVLSRLRHPHIVQLFDFGEVTPPRGPVVPYMVLELVEGGTLGAVVNHRPVPSHTTAALVEMLARALQEVHQQGIIHRDLKPGNILLQPRESSAGVLPLADPGRLLETYVPKITDFGLARELTAEPSPWTQTRDVLGTPTYMAPEQASTARELTPAADIYALGVILYELLTGLPPFRAGDWVELVVQVKEQEPLMPSSLLGGIPRDLETICLKCLQKEPARRYTSAQALADDLRRFLDGKPILARPTSLVEKFTRWARRNPEVAGLIGVVLALLVVGLGITTWLSLVAERRRGDAQDALEQLQQEQTRLKEEQGRTRQALDAERRRREQARQALEAITSQMVPDWISRSADLTAEQRQFLKRALALYQEFARDTATDEASRVGVAEALLRVAQFQRFLGQIDEALGSAAEAADTWVGLTTEFPANRDYGRNLALTWWLQAVLLRDSGDKKGCEPFVRRALALNQKLLAEGEADPKIEQQLGDCLNTLGTILRQTGRLKEAEEQWRALLPLRERVAQRDRHSAEAGIGLMWVHLNLALVLQQTSRLKEADKAIESALVVAGPLAAEHTNSHTCPEWLARCREVHGDILTDLKEPSRAEAEYRIAITIMIGLHRDYPGHGNVTRYLLRLQTNLSGFLLRQGKVREADAEARAALAVLKPVADQPGMSFACNELAGNVVNLSLVLIRQEQREEACSWLQQAEPLHKAALAAEPRNGAIRLIYRNNRALLAGCLVDLDDHAAAARTVEQWVSVAVDAKMDNYGAASCLSRCVALAEVDIERTAAQRRMLSQQYGERAVQLLKAALANGFQDREALKKDPALEAIRSRPDFPKTLVESR